MLQQFRPGGPGFETEPEVAVGDFSGDGYVDAAVGMRNAGYRDEAGEVSSQAGAVVVVRGSASGLTRDGAQVWTRASDGMNGPPIVGDHFGWKVAVGDHDGDGFSELSISAVGQDVARKSDAGAVHVLRGSGDGLTADGGSFWTQDSSAVLGIARDWDNFGSGLG
jgi:hypothetical protein